MTVTDTASSNAAEAPSSAVFGFSIAGILSALPDFGFGGMYLLTWLFPYALGAKMVSYLMLLMLMEFINVHSSGFMGVMFISDASRLQKILFIIGFGMFYTIFVGGFALAFEVWWPMWAFWIMTGNRLLGLFIGQAPTGKEKEFVIVSWAAGMVFYLGFVFITSLVSVPALGLTEDVIRAQELTGSGLWIDEPQRVLAFGFLYFTAVGVSEIFAHSVFARMRTSMASSSH